MLPLPRVIAACEQFATSQDAKPRRAEAGTNLDTLLRLAFRTRHHDPDVVRGGQLLGLRFWGQCRYPLPPSSLVWLRLRETRGNCSKRALLHSTYRAAMRCSHTSGAKTTY